MHRVLIIKLSGLGDIAQALPVATALRRAFPSLRIGWAVEDRFAALVEHHPAVDRVVRFPHLAWSAPGRGWATAVRRALAAVRHEPYDVAIDLQGLFKSSVIALASRAPRRIGVAPQREGAAWVSQAAPARGGWRHAVDGYLDAAVHLGAAPAPPRFGLRAHPAAVASLAARLRQHGIGPGDRVISIGPSASRRCKNWPADRWHALGAALAEAGRVIVVGGAEHRARHRHLTNGLRGRAADLTGETTLPELVALLDRSALHIAPDTGTLHVAAALGVAVIGIYGPTPPSRLGPYGQSDAVLHRRDACAPTCPRFCPWRRRCLRAVRPEDVLALAHHILASAAPRSAGGTHLA